MKIPYFWPYQRVHFNLLVTYNTTHDKRKYWTSWRWIRSNSQTALFKVGSVFVPIFPLRGSQMPEVSYLRILSCGLRCFRSEFVSNNCLQKQPGSTILSIKLVQYSQPKFFVCEEDQRQSFLWIVTRTESSQSRSNLTGDEVAGANRNEHVRAASMIFSTI